MKLLMKWIVYNLCCFISGAMLGCGLIKMAEVMFTED